VIAKAANTYAFLAAGQHMRSKCQLSIINNERTTNFLADADSGALGGSTAQENMVAHLRTITWAASGHHSLGPVPNLHDAGPQSWPAPSVASGDSPAFGSNSRDLEHHLFK
jgi:hypothetical protein